MMGRKLPREAIMRATGLLDMQYTPGELAEDLKLPKHTIYHLTKTKQIPHTTDKSGRVWFHGLTVAAWATERRFSKTKLAEGEGYCRRCKKGVPMIDPKQTPKRGCILIESTCPTCKARVIKLVGVKRGQ